MTALVDPMTTWATARETLGAQGNTLPPEPSTGWQRIPAAGKGERNRSAAVRLAPDGSAVFLVDHAVPYSATVQARTSQPLDADELRRARAESERRQAAARAEDARARTAVLVNARGLLDGAAAGNGHPYLAAKLLGSAHGARQTDGLLLVAGHDEHGALAFVQRIGTDGPKRLVRGISFAGAWATFGEPAGAEHIVVAIGWATSAVVFEDTGTPTLAAMCEGNVRRVATTARRLWPSASLVIAGDDDRHGQRNSGREAAEAAARATGARVLFPAFCRPDCRCSDFADVRACERREVRS